MNRFSLAVTAAVLSATAVTGVMAFSALGDDQGTPPTAADRAKKMQDAREHPGVAPPELLACLRGHGLNPPTNPMELKMWIIRTPAAHACIEAAGPKEVKPGVPDDKQGPPGDCAGGKPAQPADPAPSSSQSGSAPS
jgi:hypothetical protein